MKRRVIAAVLCLMLGGMAAELKIAADRPGALYRVGERVNFLIRAVGEGGAPLAGGRVAWALSADDGRRETGTATLDRKGEAVCPAEFRAPGFLLFTGTLPGADGKAVQAEAGAGAEPEKLPGSWEPEDFDRFWAERKAELAKVPLKFTLTKVPVRPDMRKSVELFDVQADCAGGMPVSGYYARPRGAAPKSCPALLMLHGAGVQGSVKPDNYAANGVLALNINAHGIVNGKPKAFYQELGNGELKNYWYIGNGDPGKCYFLGMYLRVLRALEFLKAQPEWDGRNLVVYGGSQGGGQALAGAALDPQVSEAFTAAPWLCDLNGGASGRIQPVWPPFVKYRSGKPLRPEVSRTMGYFDGANMAKRIQCPVVFSCGFIDRICPPASVYAAFNSVRNPEKKMLRLTGDSHAGPRVFGDVDQLVWKRIGEWKRK